MAQTANRPHLVDQVLPDVPVRQWVLSLPIPLRYLLAAHPKLLSPALEIVQRVITGYLAKKSALPRSEIHTGAVTLIQRFGSAANLNIHFHSLVLDGVYRIENGQPVFHPVAPPTTVELARLLERIVQRVLALLTRRGYWVEDHETGYLEVPQYSRTPPRAPARYDPEREADLFPSPAMLHTPVHSATVPCVALPPLYMDPSRFARLIIGVSLSEKRGTNPAQRKSKHSSVCSPSDVIKLANRFLAFAWENIYRTARY